MGQAIAMHAMLIALRGLGRFIYDYQTLLTGVGALVAAYVAAKPVWKQLALIQTQANGVQRDMLMQRQAEVEKASAALAEHMGKPLSELDRAIYWPDGEPTRLDEQQAHYHEVAISHAVSWLRADAKERDSANVESAKGRLAESTDALLKILWEIHATTSMEQVDEDHSISDEEWAALGERGEAAKGEVDTALTQTQTALRTTFEALEGERTIIKARLKKLDEALVAGS